MPAAIPSTIAPAMYARVPLRWRRPRNSSAQAMKTSVVAGTSLNPVPP